MAVPGSSPGIDPAIRVYAEADRRRRWLRSSPVRRRSTRKSWMARSIPGLDPGTAMTAGGNFGDQREPPRRMQMSPLFAWRSGAREKFEVKDDRAAVAAAGGALRASLSSNSSRAKSPPSNQWGSRRCGQRRARVRLSRCIESCVWRPRHRVAIDGAPKFAIEICNG